MNADLTQPMHIPSAPDALANAMLARALDHAEHGRHERAWEVARVVVGMRPDRVSAWLLIGDGARRAGRWQTALDAFERARLAAPHDDEVVVAHAEILIQVGKVREGRAILLDLLSRGVRRGQAAVDHPPAVIRAGALLEALAKVAQAARDHAEAERI